MFILTDCDPTNNAVFKPSTVSAGTVQQDSIEVNCQLVAVTPEIRAYIGPARSSRPARR